MARKPTNLVRRGDVFYFRTAIPSRIRKAFARLEFKVSLRTTDREQATLRQRWLSYLWEDVIQALTAMATLSPVRIDQVVREYFSEQVNNFVLHAEEGPRNVAFETDRELSDATQFLAEIRARIGSRQYTPLDKDTATGLLVKSALDVPPAGSDVFDEVCNKTLRARAEAIRIFVALLQGRHDEAHPRDPLFMQGAPVSRTINTSWSERTHLLEHLTETYVEEHRKSWAAKTVIDKARVHRWFLEVAGAKTPVTDITPDMIREFKSLLLKLPANLVKKKALDGLPLRDAIKAAEKLGMPKLSLRTADKYLGMLNSFFQWACDNSYLTVNPVGRISVPFKRSKTAEDGRSYELDQLNKLFASPLYTGHKSPSSRQLPGDVHTRDGKFWMPLIALFSGMRSGEIIQLQLQDVRKIEECWVFDVNKTDDKSLKNLNSIRQIPIHPTLVDVGFLAFVDGLRGSQPSSARLFSDIVLGKQGDPSHAYSKYYGRYTRLIGVKKDKTTFHSFRHTFTDAMRAAAIPEYVMEALTGHRRGKTSGMYGSAGTPTKLKAEAIAAVNYPGLDLSHIHD